MNKYTYKDWKGETHTVRVSGEVLLSSKEHCIYLVKLSKKTYRVHYGLEQTFHGSLEDAVADFGDCFLHAMRGLDQS